MNGCRSKTRALLDAADGEFDNAELQTEPTLGVKMPTTCAAVDDTILNPRDTWEDPAAYDEAAARLRDMFRDNFEQQNYAELGIAGDGAHARRGHFEMAEVLSEFLIGVDHRGADRPRSLERRLCLRFVSEFGRRRQFRAKFVEHGEQGRRGGV